VRGDILLTNNHVLGSPSEASRTFIEFNFEEDRIGKIGQVAKYCLDHSNFITNAELDCTAVELAKIILST